MSWVLLRRIPFLAALATALSTAAFAECGNWNTHNNLMKAAVHEVAPCIVILDDIDEYNYRGYTALHNAASAGNLEVVKLLLANGASVNAGHKQNSSATALYFAAPFPGSAEVVQELIAAGAEINNQVGNHKLTPLHLAAREGNFEVVRALLESGALITGDAEGLSPLHWAFTYGGSQTKDGGENARKTAEELISAGADPYALSANGWNPLHFAARNDAFKAISVFAPYAELAKQANIEGQTPVQLAAVWASGETMSAFLEIGASVFDVDDQSNSLLHIAAASENHLVSVFLADFAVLRDGKNDQGMTPLHVSASKGSDEVVWGLLNAGADYEQLDLSGRTAWDYVRINRRLRNTQSYWRLRDLSNPKSD